MRFRGRAAVAALGFAVLALVAAPARAVQPVASPPQVATPAAAGPVSSTTAAGVSLLARGIPVCESASMVCVDWNKATPITVALTRFGRPVQGAVIAATVYRKVAGPCCDVHLGQAITRLPAGAAGSSGRRTFPTTLPFGAFVIVTKAAYRSGGRTLTVSATQSIVVGSRVSAHPSATVVRAGRTITITGRILPAPDARPTCCSPAPVVVLVRHLKAPGANLLTQWPSAGARAVPRADGTYVLRYTVPKGNGAYYGHRATSTYRVRWIGPAGGTSRSFTLIGR